MPAQRKSRLRALALSFACAIVLTALMVGAACAVLSLTSAPAPVSLLLEPFSLLLIPGLLLALPFVGSHSEVSSGEVLLASACFYFVLLFFLSARRLLPARTHSPSR